MTAERRAGDERHELERVVARAREARADGRDDWLSAACEGDEALAERVRAAVASADALPQLLRAGGGPVSQDVIAGRYRIVRRIGAGAMGVVYEADDLSLGRRVALKLLRPGLLDHARDRFEREAHALAAVAHPSVVAIHDRGQTAAGEAFLVMELVDGCELGALVDRLDERVGEPERVDDQALERALGFPTPMRESYTRVAARWVAELAAGAAAAHAAGVIHRDIKPSNVFVRPDGRAVLLDFGVARLAESATLTGEGADVGTPAYMDPAMLAPGATASPRTDVYGLAALLYSLLALRPPFTGPPQRVLHAVSTRAPARLARRNASLPRDLVAVVEKGMERRSRDRYESAAALERDLVAFLDHLPVTARPTGVLRRAARGVRRSRAAQGALAMLAVVLVTVLAFAGHSAWLEARAERWTRLARHFPPNFTVVSAANRVVLAEPDRAALADLLDRAADVAVDPLPTRLLRASFRLDHGDPAGAAEDMRVIARHEGSAFAGALAAAYAALPADSRSSSAVELGQLPPPSTPRDRYLRAYHHVRAFELGPAVELLDEEARAALPHAEELRLALVDLGRYEPLERQRRALALHADVQRLEERLGVRTAGTAHFACYALAHANAYQSALDVGLEGVALAPRSYVNRTNVGWAAFVLGSQDQAREVLRVANELRPNDRKPVYTLVWTHVADGHFDRALEVLAKLAPDVERVSDWWAANLAAEVETYRALHELNAWTREREPDDAGAPPVPREAIASARAHLTRARELGDDGNPFVSRTLDALEARNEQALFELLAGEFAQDVRRVWRLELLRMHLPDHLDSGPMDELFDLLEALESELAGTRARPAGAR
ncbi:MAG: serine/threonine-protein kinase [Planctomycetota bacterium]